MSAREGDHLMISFECDYCIFWKVRGGIPDLKLEKDIRLMLAIRRISLDAFWSRATTTVISNRNKVEEGLRISEELGMSGPHKISRIMPEFDHCGYEVAIQMVMSSLKLGVYSKYNSQFDTIRKHLSAFSNWYKTTGDYTYETLTILSDKGVTQRVSQETTSSLWFCRFFNGCQRRMGQDWRPNQGLSIKLLIKLIQKVEEKIKLSELFETSLIGSCLVLILCLLMFYLFEARKVYC